jgi:hypothetical protein
MTLYALACQWVGARWIRSQYMTLYGYTSGWVQDGYFVNAWPLVFGITVSFSLTIRCCISALKHPLSL